MTWNITMEIFHKMRWGFYSFPSNAFYTSIDIGINIYWDFIHSRYFLFLQIRGTKWKFGTNQDGFRHPVSNVCYNLKSTGTDEQIIIPC